MFALLRATRSPTRSPRVWIKLHRRLSFGTYAERVRVLRPTRVSPSFLGLVRLAWTSLSHAGSPLCLSGIGCIIPDSTGACVQPPSQSPFAGWLLTHWSIREPRSPALKLLSPRWWESPLPRPSRFPESWESPRPATCQFSQVQNGEVRPLGWYAGTFSAAQANWDTRDRELFAVVSALRKAPQFAGGKRPSHPPRLRPHVG